MFSESVVSSHNSCFNAILVMEYQGGFLLVHMCTRDERFRLDRKPHLCSGIDGVGK